MSYSNPKQILALAIVWAASLFGVDALTARSPAKMQGPAGTPAALELHFSHGCAGCDDSVSAALLGIPDSGLGSVQFVGEDHRVISVVIASEELVDFVAIDEALRQAGFSIRNMLIHRMAGRTLTAQLPLVCRPECEGVGEAIEAEVKVQQNQTHGSHGSWIASAEAVGDGVRVSARQDSDAVDVLDALRAIEAAGFSARTLKIDRD